MFVLLVILRSYLFFTLSSGASLIDVPSSHTLLGFVYDAWFVLIVWFSLSMFEAILHLSRLKFLRFLIPSITILFLFANIVADQYFLTMYQPLDASIYYFSLEELWLIAGFEQRLSVIVILALTLLYTFYFLFVRWIKLNNKWNSEKAMRFYFWISVLAVVSLPIARYENQQNEAEDGLVNNRLMLFLNESWRFAFLENATTKAILPEDFSQLNPDFYNTSSKSKTYPLWHELPNQSALTPYFNPTSNGKAPNVVFIIVESLSSDLVGVKAKNHGNLLPFLDSLTQQSLYFPNVFSTSQRTHNVLPATLTSVPNVIDGNAFQQINYPDHWSLMRLLKSAYYSRFYCGVYLEYLNMRGFMNYHEVDYLVDDWSSKAKQHSAIVNSPWGFPDGDLFNQAFEDEQKQNDSSKSKMDVFLTISTHDPFVYPEKEKYTEIAKKRIAQTKKEPQKSSMMANAAQFGAFCYTDDQLRNFFEKWKNHPYYKNTIFVITGDHGSELCNFNKLSKYTIPLVIYSPLLKQTKTCYSVASHLDITPTLYNYLRLTYGLKVPASVPFIGKELDLSNAFHTDRSLVFTTNKLKANEGFSQGIALLDHQLYTVNKLLTPTKISNPEKLRYFKKQLEVYQAFSQYCINQNKLVPPNEQAKWMGVRTWKKSKQFETPLVGKDKAAQFTELGDFECAQNANMIRIQVFADVYCRTKDDIRQVGDLVVSTDELKWMKKEWVLFKAIRPNFTEKFKPNKNNRVAFTLEFSPKTIKRLKSKNALQLYIYNRKRIKQPIYRLETVISNSSK